jgi:hypothetical protein
MAGDQMGVLAAGVLLQRCQDFTATRPLVSGASIRMVSQASTAVSIFGRPLATLASVASR